MTREKFKKNLTQFHVAVNKTTNNKNQELYFWFVKARHCGEALALNTISY